MTHWRYVERVVVRNLGGSFIGEARTHADFVTGDICKTPEEALDNAAAKMAALLAPRYAKRAPTPDFEDLL